MSSVSNDTDVKKGGHLPATKIAGGVRIPQQKKTHSESEGKSKEDMEEEKQLQKQEQLAASERRVVISGAVAKGDQDFPPQAVRAFHEKPIPAVQQPHVPVHHHVQQPRK